MNRTPKSHWIYFIQGENTARIKIGYGECPVKRIRSIQHQCTEKVRLLAVIDLGFCRRAEAERQELSLHNQFRHCHAFAETFDPDPSLLAFIQSLLPITHTCKQCKSLPATIGSPWTKRTANIGKKWVNGKMIRPVD